MDGWIDGWGDGWVDGWMDGLIDKYSCPPRTNLKLENKHYDFSSFSFHRSSLECSIWIDVMTRGTLGGLGPTQGAQQHRKLPHDDLRIAIDHFHCFYQRFSKSHFSIHEICWVNIAYYLRLMTTLEKPCFSLGTHDAFFLVTTPPA